MGRGTVRGEEGAGRGRRGGRTERAVRGAGQGGDRGANRSWIDGSNTRTASYAQRPPDRYVAMTYTSAICSKADRRLFD